MEVKGIRQIGHESSRAISEESLFNAGSDKRNISMRAWGDNDVASTSWRALDSMMFDRKRGSISTLRSTFNTLVALITWTSKLRTARISAQLSIFRLSRTYNPGFCQVFPSFPCYKLLYKLNNVDQWKEFWALQWCLWKFRCRVWGNRSSQSTREEASTKDRP